MSEDTVALVITVGFFICMAAWVPLVECCGRKLRARVGREQLDAAGTPEKRIATPRSRGRGYETAVLLVMVAMIGSLI
jgi:hypothetical protein